MCFIVKHYYGENNSVDTILAQLEECFSVPRLAPYKQLAKTKGFADEKAADLYRLNILICEELYAFISCIEVCLRNKINRKIVAKTGNKNWFDKVKWLDKHAKALAEAKKSASGKRDANADDIISRINLGFWCHIFDVAYEQTLWIPYLRFLFPNYVGAPSRNHISAVFNNLLKMRNRIAHFEPIIKDEKALLKSYNQMVELMNWMCPEIYNWFETFNKFKALYNELVSNS